MQIKGNTQNGGGSIMAKVCSKKFVYSTIAVVVLVQAYFMVGPPSSASGEGGAAAAVSSETSNLRAAGADNEHTEHKLEEVPSPADGAAAAAHDHSAHDHSAHAGHDHSKMVESAAAAAAAPKADGHDHSKMVESAAAAVPKAESTGGGHVHGDPYAHLKPKDEKEDEAKEAAEAPTPGGAVLTGPGNHGAKPASIGEQDFSRYKPAASKTDGGDGETGGGGETDKKEGEEGGAPPPDFCTKSRDGLPSKWTLKVVDEKCVRVCPLWDEAEIWFRNGRSKMTWMDKLFNKGAPVLEKAMDVKMSASSLEISMGTLLAMPPSDAVRLCGVACVGKKSTHTKFADAFCDCGEFPHPFLDVNPKFSDYSTLYTQADDGDSESLPKSAVLAENHSQPRC